MPGGVQYTDQMDTQGMDTLVTPTMAITTTIRPSDITDTDHLFHSVTLVVILTTMDTTTMETITMDFEAGESVLSTIEIFCILIMREQRRIASTWSALSRIEGY